MPDFPLVYCTVLNYNGKGLLLITLESLYKMTYPNFKVVVVDNGSTDGSQQAVRSKYPQIEIIENKENLGVMAGYNTGLQYGLEKNAEWLFLLNNDISVDPNLLTALMEVAISDEKVGALGPKIYFESEPNKFWYAGGRINFFTGIISHRGIRKEDKGQYDRIEETGYITGCAMLIKREVVEKVGMMDLIFSPMYSEDADFCMRVKRSGYSLIYVPKAKLWHKVSAFSGGGLTPLKTMYKVEHNFIVFKRYAKWYHWLTMPWCIGAMTVIFIIKELFKGNFRIISALFNGFLRLTRKQSGKERDVG